MNQQGLSQIGELAEHVGLSLRTLRCYEEVGTASALAASLRRLCRTITARTPTRG